MTETTVLSAACQAEESTQANAFSLHAANLRALGRVYRVALGVTCDPDSALDVAQNVFLRVHAGLAGWRGSGELEGWIASVAQNRPTTGTTAMAHRARTSGIRYGK